MQDKSYVLVDSYQKVTDLFSDLSKAEIVSFDTETTSLNPRKGSIIGFSVSTEEGNGYYLPTLIYDPSSNSFIKPTVEKEGKTIELEEVAKRTIKNLIVGKKLIMHNASFDCRFVKSCYGIDLTPSLYADTMLLVHTVREDGVFGKFGLKEIAKSIQKELGLDMEKRANEEQLELKASIKANGGSITSQNYEIFKADINILAKYAAADTDLTLRIYNHYIKVLEKEGLSDFYFKDEVMPLYKEVTIPMEETGVRLDMKLISEAKTSIEES